MQVLLRSVTRLLLAIVLCALTQTASAEFSIYDTQTYDYLGRGAPKFVKTDYIDLNKVTQISKFRSFAGHNYSDFIQFGSDAIKIQFKAVESCVSMKHYYSPPDANAVIRAPVSGVISRVFEEELGTQIHITSDAQPAFTFSIFHIVTPTPVAVGDRVEEGQVLGHHWGQQTFSDMAVAVHTPTGYHLISYFETMTDELFATYQARGITSRESMIIPREVTDADLNRCSEFTSDPNTPNFINLTGGAATQTLTAKFTTSFWHAGETMTVAATASSGLPVRLASNAPKICAVNGLSVSFRRAGTCVLQVAQDGNATTFSAQSYFPFTVAPAGAFFTGSPRLGAVFPPSATGAQSYLRFIAGYTGGSVTLTLTDADTGKDKLTWISPTVAPFTAPQVSIAEIEATAPAGYQRPAMYGLRIEPVTTLQGALQHVLYRPSDGTITNLTTCDAGLGTPQTFMGNVHSSRLAGFPSTIIAHNPTAFDFMNIFLSPYDAATGKSVGNTYTRDNTMPANSAAILPVSDLERAMKITPSINHYLLTTSSVPSYALFQHLVTNLQAGVVADMTAVCNLIGGGIAGPATPVRGGALFGTTQAASQSFLRFYNSGATAGPVKVTLYDAATGASLGQWTSPTLTPGTELQTQIGALEQALVSTPRDNYEFRIDTDIDGAFQHVLWRTADGTLTKLSTCNAGVGADPYAVFGVHSALVAAQGYQSTIDVISTGNVPQTVTLGLYDARNGARLGTYTTAPIPPSGQRLIDVASIEASAHLTPDAGLFHYVVKAEAPFAGFLQHLVNNLKSGVTTDMTTQCAM